jgi:hypothetical protein
MACDGILRCFQQKDRWFSGVVVTDGAGSPRDGLYEHDTDEMMREILDEDEDRWRALERLPGFVSQALALAHTPLKIPPGLPEWLTPIVAIVVVQLFCYHVTRAKGLDTENPRGLRKVTLTR